MHILVMALHRPTKPTGVCRHAANLVKCLAERDEVGKISLLIGSWQKEYFLSNFSLDFDKVEVVSVDISNDSLSRNNWYLFGLPKIAKEISPDILHFLFPAPFIRSFFQCSVVSTINDLYAFELPDQFGYPQVWLNQLFMRICITQSDGLACISNTTLKNLKKYFPQIYIEKEVITIYQYVDFGDIKSTAPKLSRHLAQGDFFLTVAQHRKNKNLDLLISTFQEMINDKQVSLNKKLVIIGSSGPETSNLERQIIDSSLQDSVFMGSALSDSELCWLYGNCDLFVIPSSTEGFCIPLVEALSLGCRAVCSDIPTLKEVGNPQCFYFSLEVNPVLNLSQAIVEALKSSSNRILEDRFSKPRAAKQYLAFYEHFIAPGDCQ